MLFFNPPGKGRGMARRRKRRKLAGAALAAHRKRLGLTKRKKRRSSKRRRHTARTTRRAGRRVAQHGGLMARRKRHRRNPRRRSHRRRALVRRNDPGLRRHRRRHRRYRRNPAFSVGGVMKQATQGVKDAAAIVVGKAATRAVSNLIPIGTNTGVIGAVKQVLVAVGVGYGASKLVKRGEFARFVTAGGIAGALETIVKSLNIPIISTNLGDGAEYSAVGGGNSAMLPGMSAYPLSPGVSAYPLGDYGDGMGELGMMGAM
jgi:hypothetical protein